MPVALAGDDPLRSIRLMLLPVPPVALRTARIVAGAPLRILFVIALPCLGAVAARGVVPRDAPLPLVGWALIAFVLGAALDEHWHRPRAGLTRTASAAAAAIGAWCLWFVRAPRAATELAFMPAIPTLLPRVGDVADWYVALAVAVTAVGVSALALRSGGHHHVGPAAARRWSSPLSGWPRARTATARAIAPFAAPPRLASEVRLLARHIGPRVSLALVVLLACAATYGRVPGLALVACAPMAILTANSLGGDVPLAGQWRHVLLPQSLARVRDRRLTIWALATAIAALLGTCIGLALPIPQHVGQPSGGRLAAPALLLYGASLIPWFGRASWWWARRHPRAIAQRLRDVGSRSAAQGPTGPAHLAIALLGGWALVALLASLLWAASYEGARSLVASAQTMLTSTEFPAARSSLVWVGSTLVAAVSSFVAHDALSRIRRRAQPACEAAHAA